MRVLQDFEYVVCMTGDGANDSGALKAADIGISIASAKSVLTAPTEEGEVSFIAHMCACDDHVPSTDRALQS